jgi:hypothetical protein
MARRLAFDLRGGLRVLALGGLVSVAGLAAGGASAASADDRSAPVAARSEQTGSSSAAPGGFTLADLKGLVPQRIGSWHQVSFNVPLGEKVPGTGRTFEATFRHGSHEALVRVADMGEAALPTAKPWTAAPVEQETETGRAKIYGERGHTVREEIDRSGKHRSVSRIFPNGLMVSAESQKASTAELKQLTDGVDLAKGAALAR